MTVYEAKKSQYALKYTNGKYIKNKLGETTDYISEALLFSNKEYAKRSSLYHELFGLELSVVEIRQVLNEVSV